MLSTRKPGPPVPPRPSAAAVAHALQKHGDKSPTNNSGRTVVYKSPSYDQKKPVNNEPGHKHIIDPKKTGSVIILEEKRNQSTKKYTSTCNLNSSSSASTSASSSPSSTLSKEDKKNIVIISNNNNNGTTTTKTDNLEIENNLRNLVNQKLFTEIIINSSNKTNPPTIVEAKNRNVNVLRSSSVKLPLRPDPEGGERTIDDKICEKKSAFHELLISELTAMRKDGGAKRQRHPSDRRSIEVSPNGTTRSKIRTSDWIEVGDNGKEVLLSSCQISLEDSGLEDELEKLDDASSGVGDSWDSVKEERVKMSLPGLPPLPKSLSGFDISGQQQQQQIHQHLLQQQQQMQQSNSTTSSMSSLDSRRGPSPVNRKPETLDTQLAVLRREMYGLRQLDLSLLSQLWALNESIQEFRSILQEQETLSPPSPSPSNSDANSVSSDDDGEDDDESSHNIEKTISAANRMRTAPPPPPPNRKAPSRPV